ncbi:sigma-70 family RNA polymerase sigma factor [Dyadobacter sp. CY261]|uniref:RNA polymerase sigma factor n=1 Tax=Dyadobacter sp. CY261 TaxID=2907203 RepID=UPI001F1F6EA4|nr:sigma-70 family RNA polymerase sigma factor [Dyadobacter sp. CY261]MCF0074060.1 sigma-70 family RNA polymerase sigma factor [Dyadobacter sp. CY261]
MGRISMPGISMPGTSMPGTSADGFAGADDASLWDAFKKGDRLAFARLYQLHVHHLIRYGYKVTSNRSLIQDCTQDLFVELWENRENLTDIRSLRYYLLKSLRYKLVRHLRFEQPDNLDEERMETHDDHFESQTVRQETLTRQSRQLETAMAQLPKRQQEAIHLRFFHELTNEEVARIMGVNYQSACKFIYTGLKTLREIMQLSSVIPVLFSFFLKS